MQRPAYSRDNGLFDEQNRHFEARVCLLSDEQWLLRSQSGLDEMPDGQTVRRDQ